MADLYSLTAPGTPGRLLLSPEADSPVPKRPCGKALRPMRADAISARRQADSA